MNRMELDRFVADYGFSDEFAEDEENISFEEQVRRTIILAKGGKKVERTENTNSI